MAEKLKGFKKYLFNIILIIIILLGVCLRSKGFLANLSLWSDECGLAWNIKFKHYSDFFRVLQLEQMAPPFFMVATKLFTKILGFSDLIFRLIPFLCGCLSIPAFYFLSKKVLKTKVAILSVVFLFAINQRLINYSFEFKQYSSDVFLTILCLLFFINLDVEKLNIKKVLLYGILLSIVPWCSFVSVFIIAAGFLNLLFTNIKTNLKKKAILILPIIISCLIYLKIYLVSNYNGLNMVNYWHNYFLTSNPLFSLHLLIESIRYLFFSIQFILLFLILFILGIIIFYREKNSFFNISILSLILLSIASFLHIYPFGERLILFLIPIYLLFMIKPLDFISFNKKIKSFITIFLIIIIFYPQIISAAYFFKYKTLSRGEYAHEMMTFMVENLKPDDMIFVNAFSDTEFSYYSSFYKIKNKVIQEKSINRSKEECWTFLNSFKKGYYWFYMPDNVWSRTDIQYLLSWVKTKEIFYSFRQNASLLLYVHVK